ncbi:MAG: hypothetical protein AAGL29_14945 [Bacteroidota bacterium]
MRDSPYLKKNGYKWVTGMKGEGYKWVTKCRNRLRKKLNLTPDDDLSAFLRTF